MQLQLGSDYSIGFLFGPRNFARTFLTFYNILNIIFLQVNFIFKIMEQVLANLLKNLGMLMLNILRRKNGPAIFESKIPNHAFGPNLS